ncbi:hypothetical protein ISN45_Un173g000020 [Arabidopsis thaliana x Arabidopsis arenosa]|uniref:Uncharacterized protein n=1 Tax=Arabidopsis thaliana x Arabidopsis arenosa TaxID=1240361 RepID=A0A8T1XG39_9BRAS|nr:hypothetical protein ISN45_Un173g000020 [Arabidopsis thaliana x Arabidopsis arenosa]
MRGMTRILRGLGVAVYWESAWYTEMSPRASFHPVAEENGRVMTWADMDSPRPWVAVVTSCGFLGVTSSLPFADVLGNHLLMGSGYRLVVTRGSRFRVYPSHCGSDIRSLGWMGVRKHGSAKAVSTVFRACAALAWIRPSSLFSAEYFGGVGERLMFLGQLNVRRMSGDRIASVCRLRARAPNYLPPILLSYFTGDVTLDDRIRGLCCVPN